MRWLILALAAIPAFALWAWVVFLGTSGGWWREPLAPPGDGAAFAAAVAAEIDARSRGNAAFRLLEDGRVAGEHYASIGPPVGPHTRFQTGSVSKWLTAWGVMRLVQDGRLALDAPVSTYLTRWQLPESAFDNDEVTVRRLLSHTAGLTDGLGYNGFAPGTVVQPLEESLTRAADAMPGADGRVRVGVAPGEEWLYSGGGYALLQLLVEEVTGEAFAAYMQQRILEPLGLEDSGFGVPEGEEADVATSYDSRGNPAPDYHYTALAAAGLYTSAADMSRFLQAQLPGPDGQPPGRGVLAPATLTLMRQPQASAFGTDIWGLGNMLYANNGAGGHIIGHEGANRPAVNASVRLDPASGDGIVLLVTGNPSLADELGSEWVFWHTGKLDVLAFYEATGEMILIIAAGWGVIALIVVVVGWLSSRTSPRSPKPGREGGGAR